MICILWSRLGSRLHPGIHQRDDGSAYGSGTEYEFEDAARLSAEGTPVALSWAERTAVASELSGIAATDRVAAWIRWVYSPAEKRSISPFVGEPAAAPPDDKGAR